MNKNRPTSRKVTHSGGSSSVGRSGGGRGSGRVGGGGFFGGSSSGGGSHGSGGSGYGGSGGHGSGGSYGSGGHGSGGSHGPGSSHGSGGSHSSHGSGYGGSGHSSGYSSGGGFGTVTRSKPGCIGIIVILLAIVFGGGGLALNGFSGGSDYQDLLQSGGGSYSGWLTDNASTGNTGVLNTDVDPAARAKFTTLRGNGKDQSTIMVYMCGTDLESRSGMATSDLNEMLSATVGKNINLLIYTGGCKGWRNSTISSAHNQIWQISNGSIKCLVKNAGNDSMTKASTLSSFLKWGAQHFPADRMSLIFWDHGGGSVSGYGYDEKYPRSGSMNLAGINTALKESGIKYDFIGFDACLMATAETALMVSNYADYMIGSEETEPGIGWYYTNWLSSLSKDPSMETLQIGRQIVDDFTAQCAKQCRGQSTTLSVVDLAELSQTLPEKLNAFAEDTGIRISDGEYQRVAAARSGSKEFARSSGIDQIDLTHFAGLLDSEAGKQLSRTLLSAVKYNRTSSNMANAYGLSIYFPYKKLAKVDSMTDTYEKIGMDDDYTACIRQFAQMQTCGQAAAGGTASPMDAILGGGSSSQDLTSQAMQQLFNALLSGRFTDFKSLGIDGLDASNTGFLSKDSLNASEVADYIEANRITAEDLAWQENSDGKQVISLSEEQWEVVSTADKTVIANDGDGLIDLGLDNVFDFDDDGNLLPDTSRSWLSIDGQPVAYYHTETQDFSDGTYSITGYVPVELNGKTARLILTFDSDNEDGYIAGVSYDYAASTTETQAKNLEGLKEGDQVKFLADGYSYEGAFEDNFQLGRTWTVRDPKNVKITNTDLEEDAAILYKFTDIYGQEFWTPEVRQ